MRCAGPCHEQLEDFIYRCTVLLYICSIFRFRTRFLFSSPACLCEKPIAAGIAFVYYTNVRCYLQLVEIRAESAPRIITTIIRIVCAYSDLRLSANSHATTYGRTVGYGASLTITINM